MNNHEIQPLTETRRASMSWPEFEQTETAIAQHILHITTRHFTAAGLTLLRDIEATSYWFLFGINLSAATIEHTRKLNDADYLAFLRALWAEIFDFLMFVYDGVPEYPLSELMRAFGSDMKNGPTLPRLLPDRAQPILAAANEILAAQHEEELWRMNQMGY